MMHLTPSAIDRLDDLLGRLLGATAGCVLAIMTLVCAAEVVARNVVGRSLGWYDELAGYLLVWLTFVGAALAQRTGDHIGAATLVGRAGPRLDRTLRAGAEGLLLVLQAAIVYSGIGLAARAAPDRATMLPVSMGLLYAIVPATALAAGLLHLVQLVRLIRKER